MKLVIGGYYASKSGTVYGPMVESKSPVYPFMVDLKVNRNFMGYTWTAEGIFDVHRPGNIALDLIRVISLPEQVSEHVDIDQVTIHHLTRGVAKIWDTYKVRY